MARGETREEFAQRKATEVPKPAAAAVDAPKAPEAKPLPPAVDFVCGLRKVGPGAYAVVVGRVVDGRPELKVDTVSQPLDHAALTLTMKLRGMIGEMP